MMKARNSITEGCDTINRGGHTLCARASVLTLVSFLALGASWSTPPPDPVGEHAYTTHALAGMIPLAIIVGALLVAWCIAKSRRKAKSVAPERDRNIP